MKTFVYPLLALLFCYQSSWSDLHPRELLQQSLVFFDKGHYHQALNIIAPVDVQRDFDSSDDMLMAFRIRAVSYAETGDKKRAAEAIRELLFLSPHYKFDPFDTPASVVELAAIEVREIEQKNQSLAALKSQSIIELPSVETTAVLIPKKPLFVTTLFPLGVNHFYQGSNIKGSLYLALQASSLVANIGSYWWKQSYLKEYGTSKLEYPHQKSRFEIAQTIQYVALGALVISLGASIVDAMISYFKSSAQNSRQEEITIKNS